MNIIFAKDLRNAEQLHKIPNDKPGWYRWWATKAALECLLDSPYISRAFTNELLPHLTQCKYGQTEYYCIYVGVAVKGSIRSRLNWHINQNHTESAVQSGYLSTFRKTVSSLVAGNQYNEVATNALIDMLAVEYYAVDYPIKSDIAKEEITKIENSEMANNTLPLNIKGNRNPALSIFLCELMKARKQSK
jgi:hypothetical protein